MGVINRENGTAELADDIFSMLHKQPNIFEKLQEENVKSIEIHKPGSRKVYGDVIYEVNEDGKWVKVGLA